MTDLTVLTPSFGYGRFIEDTILSVLRQEDLNLEHIVQDGGSKDQTVELLERYEKWVTWRMEPDGGQSDALNRAVLRATGRWIAWINADEFYMPGALSLLTAVAEESKADVAFGDAIFVDETGRFMRLLPQHKLHMDVLRHYGPYISSCSTVFRRSVLGDHPWDNSLRKVMDWDLYLRLCSEGARFVYVRWPIGVFRVHPARVTARPESQFEEEYGTVRRRHQIPEARGTMRARWTHRVLKSINGDYYRQLQSRRFRGKDLRWFISERESSAAYDLVRRCYGESPWR